MKKYAMIETDTVVFEGKELHRIQAKRDIITADGRAVQAGDLGGYIESGRNLTQAGDCWVADNAIVAGNARVKDDAIACDNAIIYGKAVLADCSVVGGSCVIGGSAKLCGSAKLDGELRLSGTTWVRSGRLTGKS